MKFGKDIIYPLDDDTRFLKNYRNITFKVGGSDCEMSQEDKVRRIRSGG